MSQEPTITIGCLAKDFLPETLNFSWNDKSNNSFTNGMKTYKSILQSSGSYAASSQIQVTGESWNNRDPYYCVAKHSLNNKVLKLVNDVKPVSPIVTMAAPVKEDLYMNNNGTIVCIMNNYYPNNIKVKWLKNYVETTLNTMTDKANTNADGNFVLSSFMTVSKKDWDEDTIFSCVVEHSASGSFEFRNVSKSLACESSASPGDIHVYGIPPSFESIFLNKKAPLTCVIANMMSAEGLDVSWYELGSDIKLKTILDDPIYKDGAYSIKATATVCADDWLTKTFECRVKHPDLTSPKKITLAKDNGQEPQTPTVLLYPPHQDELNRKESVTLTCMVKHFYPEDILVKWTSSDQVEDRYVVTTKPMLESYSSGKKSYFLYSTLTIPSIETWNSGKSYTCVVGHESLPLQATQRSIDKTIVHILYIEEDDDIDNLWTTASTFIVLFLLSLFYSATVTLFKVRFIETGE
ncbi:unnamed protein product [Ranitomeya imitator]|uniref:Ig-like domain-containing protein n=1 Tax=Ranitomeya imitator TaxID=111125 RepID=A0ABN9LW72_9NEOB|nr:unnamed protein product [Ranitomeya imitator]